MDILQRKLQQMEKNNPSKDYFKRNAINWLNKQLYFYTRNVEQIPQKQSIYGFLFWHRNTLTVETLELRIKDCKLAIEVAMETGRFSEYANNSRYWLEQALEHATNGGSSNDIQECFQHSGYIYSKNENLPNLSEMIIETHSEWIKLNGSKKIEELLKSAKDCFWYSEKPWMNKDFMNWHLKDAQKLAKDCGIDITSEVKKVRDHYTIKLRPYAELTKDLSKSSK